MPTKPQGHKSHSVPKYLQTLSFKNVQMWNIWKTVGLYITTVSLDKLMN